MHVMFFELNGSLQRISCVSILKAIFWSGFLFYLLNVCVADVHTQVCGCRGDVDDV